jgi:hypothetical protein
VLLDEPVFGMKWGSKSQLGALERRLAFDDDERRRTDGEEREERR